MRISDWSSDVCSSDLYRPELVENNGYIHRDFPEDYHLSVDLADKAIALIDAHVADKGDQPFFLNLGFGTAHKSEEHTSELQSLMRISYAVFCLKKKNKRTQK